MLGRNISPVTTTASIPSTTAISACETSRSPCFNGGTCIPLPNFTFKCQCSSNWGGPFCMTKMSVAAVSSTSKAPTTISQNTCPTGSVDGCHPMEIVFMIEYSQSEGQYDINIEGDFIQLLLDKFIVNESHTRVGVVVFHDSVTETIHITDYKNDVAGLKQRVETLTRYCNSNWNSNWNHDGNHGRRQASCSTELKPNGEPDFAKALDYARQTSFKGSRPGVPKVLMPILHSVRDRDAAQIQAAAQRLKDDCIQITSNVVVNSYGHVNEDLIKSISSQPTDRHYFRYTSFGSFGLEGAARRYRCHE